MGKCLLHSRLSFTECILDTHSDDDNNEKEKTATTPTPAPAPEPKRGKKPKPIFVKHFSVYQFLLLM